MVVRLKFKKDHYFDFTLEFGSCFDVIMVVSIIVLKLRNSKPEARNEEKVDRERELGQRDGLCGSLPPNFGKSGFGNEFSKKLGYLFGNTSTRLRL